MKNCLIALLSIVLCLTCSLGSAERLVYTGRGMGRNGEIAVDVSLEDDTVIDVVVKDHSETAGIADPAIESIPKRIVEAHSLEVETVSGATMTSEGIIAAVADALMVAGLDEAEAMPIEMLNHGERNTTESLDAWRKAWIRKEAESSIKYAPKVKTLENGIKIQRVPSDSSYWNTGIIYAEERGCTACHKLEEAIEWLPKKHNTIDPIGTIELSVGTCMGCHRGYHESWGVVLDDAIHSLHYNSNTFNGNCLSCHQIDSEGNYVLWDYVKYDVMMGITPVSDVLGKFRYDQNVLTSIEDTFMLTAECLDPNGIPLYAPDNEEAYNNWEIRISGDVEKPYSIRLGDVREEDMVTYIMTQRCGIENGGLISTHEFSGIRMADALAAAEPKEGANQVHVLTKGFEEVGSYSVTLEEIMESEKTMLALRANGEKLSSELGYPVRCVFEGMPAGHNHWHVFELVVDTVDEPMNTFGNPHYGMEAEGIRNCPSGAITNVYDGQIFEYGDPITFEGYVDAFSDTITCVKFSLDNGQTWTKYDIPDADNDRWVYFWYEPQDLPLGSYVLTVSAETAGKRVADHDFKLLFHVQ